MIGTRWVRAWKDPDGVERLVKKAKGRLTILAYQDPDLPTLVETGQLMHSTTLFFVQLASRL